MLDYTNCDALMIARASQGNLFIFKEVTHFLSTGELLEKPTLNQKVDTAIIHLEELIKVKGEYTGIREMRKHIGWYIKGMPKSAEKRALINRIDSKQEMLSVLLDLKC
ncbi:MAG: tRNA-dihydrouridine synthase [bacterium]